ncbi:MAG: GatB/YqeY domain-containing protein [Pseudomonadota bacterium]|nr:GatB/YqeY domain-containing protein [Pseudomonadota bacterium]MEC7942477.1 GatB/YqeY domain-containing protein [Pseudomonadota bacterium]MEC8288944.1 GatB/YqeY domain-containing protein [Pseudomonadota bacterium]MEC8725457.1 GatB/YqeY domain-containing protein [Pseudomonadota bacterium]
MLRDDISSALKSSMKEKDPVAVSTLRLIQAAIKDRDIAARSKGVDDGISDDQILQVLQTMVRQRHESIEMYKRGNRDELAEREAQEIKVIQGFMPRQLNETETEAAIDEVVAATGAKSIKDMGKAMGALRERYAGQIDFGKAGAALKARLAG